MAVELFGPIEYRGTVNKGLTRKKWGVMFICTAPSEVHVKCVDTYSTDSFLMALRRFLCAKGTPSRIYSDRGDQLVAASKQIKVGL